MNVIPADQVPGWVVILPVKNTETGDEVLVLPVIGWTAREQRPVDGVKGLDMVPIVQDPKAPIATDLYTLLRDRFEDIKAQDVILRQRMPWVTVGGEVRYM